MGSSYSSLSTKPQIVFTPNGSRHQSFSFPPDVIKFILKNIESPNLYRKLVRTCKYFYSKKRIVIHDTEATCTRDMDKWVLHSSISLESKHYHLWLTYSLWCDTLDSSAVSKLLQNVYRCTFKELHLSHQNLTFEEYYLLVSSKTVESCSIEFSTICYKNGSIAPFEDILEQLPKIVYFRFIPPNYNIELHYTPKTAQNLIDLPVFATMKVLKLFRINEMFDYISFCEFIKKNSKSSFCIMFLTSTTEQYRRNFKNCVDKMLKEWNVPARKPKVILTHF